MEEYLNILLANPFFQVQKSIEDQFITYVFEWEIEDISANGLSAMLGSLGTWGTYCTQLDYDLEKRDRLLRLKLHQLDYFDFNDFETLQKVRPILFHYSGICTQFGGYTEGKCVDGIFSISTNIPADQLTISPAIEVESLTDACRLFDSESGNGLHQITVKGLFVNG